jgi:dCTP deaminase
MTFSLKNDRWIAFNSSVHGNKAAPLIAPFHSRKIRTIFDEDCATILGSPNRPCVSFGLSSYGYDLSLSGDDFRVFKRVPGAIMDPHEFDASHLEQAELRDELSGRYFILPAHSYALGVVKEYISMPTDILGICIGKSTYARLGIICNMTPVEPGWEGHLTLELSNSSGADCKIYADEGICQILFFQGEPCAEAYGDGKYQGQAQEVTIARMM